MLKRHLATVAIAGAAAAVHAADAQKVTRDVKGMHCATCPVTVKVVLKKQPVAEAGYPSSPRK